MQMSGSSAGGAAARVPWSYPPPAAPSYLHINSSALDVSLMSNPHARPALPPILRLVKTLGAAYVMQLYARIFINSDKVQHFFFLTQRF